MVNYRCVEDWSDNIEGDLMWNTIPVSVHHPSSACKERWEVRLSLRERLARIVDEIRCENGEASMDGDFKHTGLKWHNDCLLEADRIIERVKRGGGK